VNAVQWHPKEGTLLATGSFDKTIALLDARSNGENVKRVKIPSDCEALAWDPFHPEYLTVAAEDGTLYCWDVRKFETSSPAWTFNSSEFGGLNDLSYNPNIPGMLATCSIDNTATLWDTYKDNVFSPNTPPQICMKKDMAGGRLYAVQFYPSSPWLLGCGGSGKQLSLWHTDSEERIQTRFGDRQQELGKEDDIKTVKEDFEAMMAEKRASEPVPATTRNKKKRGAKKKAHKRR
jgi:periodic tryptophan protein 1